MYFIVRNKISVWLEYTVVSHLEYIVYVVSFRHFIVDLSWNRLILNYLRNVINTYRHSIGVLLPMDKDMYPNQDVIFSPYISWWEKNTLCFKRCISYISILYSTYDDILYIIHLINHYSWGPTSDFVFMCTNAIYCIIYLPIILWCYKLEIYPLLYEFRKKKKKPK